MWQLGNKAQNKKPETEKCMHNNKNMPDTILTIEISVVTQEHGRLKSARPWFWLHRESNVILKPPSLDETKVLTTDSVIHKQHATSIGVFKIYTN